MHPHLPSMAHAPPPPDEAYPFAPSLSPNIVPPPPPVFTPGTTTNEKYLGDFADPVLFIGSGGDITTAELKKEALTGVSSNTVSKTVQVDEHNQITFRTGMASGCFLSVHPQHPNGPVYAMTQTGALIVPKASYWIPDSSYIVIQCYSPVTIALRGTLLTINATTTNYTIKPITSTLHHLALRLMSASRAVDAPNFGPVVLMMGKGSMDKTSFLSSLLSMWGTASTVCVLDPFADNTHPDLITPPGTIGFSSSVPGKPQIWNLVADEQSNPIVNWMPVRVEDVEEVHKRPLCEVEHGAMSQGYLKALSDCLEPLKQQIECYLDDVRLDAPSSSVHPYPVDAANEVIINAGSYHSMNQRALSVTPSINENESDANVARIFRSDPDVDVMKNLFQDSDTKTHGDEMEPLWPLGVRTTDAILTPDKGPLIISVPSHVWDNYNKFDTHLDCELCLNRTVELLNQMVGVFKPNMIYMSDNVLDKTKRISDLLELELASEWELDINKGIKGQVLGGVLGGVEECKDEIYPIIMIDNEDQNESVEDKLIQSSQVAAMLCPSYRAQWMSYFYGYGGNSDLRQVGVSLLSGQPMNNPPRRALSEHEVETCIKNIRTVAYSYSNYLYPTSIWCPAMSGTVNMAPASNVVIRVRWKPKLRAINKMNLPESSMQETIDESRNVNTTEAIMEEQPKEPATPLYQDIGKYRLEDGDMKSIIRENILSFENSCQKGELETTSAPHLEVEIRHNETDSPDSLSIHHYINALGYITSSYSIGDEDNHRLTTQTEEEAVANSNGDEIMREQEETESQLPPLIPLDGILHIRKIGLPAAFMENIDSSIIQHCQEQGIPDSAMHAGLIESCLDLSKDEFLLEITVDIPAVVLQHMQSTSSSTIHLPYAPKAPLRWLPGTELDALTNLKSNAL